MDTPTRSEQVLRYLLVHFQQWVDGPELANERVGGSEGLRRVRELRDLGYDIQERKHPDPGRDVHQYRLAAKQKRVTPNDVPLVKRWACETCGKTTTNVDQMMLGGYAKRICPNGDCPSRGKSKPPKQAFFLPVRSP